MAIRHRFVHHFSVAGPSHEIFGAQGVAFGCGLIWTRLYWITRCPLPEKLTKCIDSWKISATLVSTSAFSEPFSGFSAMWTCKSDSLMLQSTPPRNSGVFNVRFPHRVSINVGQDFQVSLTSHQEPLRPLQREATRNAMASRRLANLLPNLSVSKLYLQSLHQLSCTTEGARVLCVRDCETFSESCRAPQCQCPFGSCGYQSACWR